MKITFEVLGIPTGKGRPKVVRRANLPYPVAITPEKTKRAEESFLSQALPHKPSSPWTGPLVVQIIAVCPVPKSWSKKQHTAAITGERMPTGKPDLDNIAKLILDAMNGVFFVDDAQVIDLRLAKAYGVIPMVQVTLMEALPPTN